MKSCSFSKAPYKHSFLCEYYNDLSFLLVLPGTIAHPGSDPAFIFPIYLCMNSHGLADDPYLTLCSLAGQAGDGRREEDNRDMNLLCPYTFCSPNCCRPIWVSQISWIHKYRHIAVKAWFPGNTASIDFEIVVLHNSKMQCILALGGSCAWGKAEASHTPAQRNYTSHATALLPSLPVSPEMACRESARQSCKLAPLCYSRVSQTRSALGWDTHMERTPRWLLF